MGLFAAITAFLEVATVYLGSVWPIAEARRIEREIEAYEDEISSLGDRGTPADKLRIEVLARRLDRATQQIGIVRSAVDYFAGRD